MLLSKNQFKKNPRKNLVDSVNDKEFFETPLVSYTRSGVVVSAECF
jgi:hypothetical protein